MIKTIVLVRVQVRVDATGNFNIDDLVKSVNAQGYHPVCLMRMGNTIYERGQFCKYITISARPLRFNLPELHNYSLN